MHLLHPTHALGRVGYALLAGTAAALALGAFAPAVVTGLAAWDTAGLVLLSLAWWHIWTLGADETAKRAAGDDPGRTAVYALVLLTSAISVFAATAIAHHADALVLDSNLLILLCLGTVALSWSLTHTSFTMRYAHLYYRDDDEGRGGLEFPGGAPPTYFDFAYFSFTIGMCFQVSDVTISSGQIRRAVLLHALMSFAYSTVILAFTLNLTFGAFG